MSNFDLSDVCRFLKNAIIMETPNNFTVTEKFRHGLTDDEIKKGIASFRSFLCKLFDALSANKDNIDVKTGINYNPKTDVRDGGSIHKHFPIINELAMVLYAIGYHGRLETNPRKEIVVFGHDLLMPLPPKSEIRYSISKMARERKMEVFNFLSDIGFYFEDANFTEKVDLDNTGTFYIQYDYDEFLPVGIKLLAEAQANIKANDYKFTTAFMRGDFYPLADPKPKKQVVYVSQYINTQSSEIIDWLTDINKLLLDNNCRVDGDTINFGCGAFFTYTSRKSKKKICKIELGVAGCTIQLWGNHLAAPNNILFDLTENMKTVAKNGRPCGACASNDPNFIRCTRGGAYKYKVDDKHYERCCFHSFCFQTDDAYERELLTKWIKLELFY
ncbi:MAG: hypothetical protein FWC16_08685 [Defluviitaleaceae bacterium]|nr:hypothetical protein [Defluviitaleaceae bacterium]MCL2274987.1 hypothetical protein [Defluviitaleaceae bacterium]